MSQDALVVGINKYPFLKDSATGNYKHLTTPATDAEAIAQLLETHGNFRVKRFPASNIDGKLQVDPDKLVKTEELEAAILDLFLPESGKPPETALLFFAGHGLRKQLRQSLTQGFLATSDASPSKNLWGLSLRELWEILQQSQAQQQVIWLDCCFSGELLNFKYTELGRHSSGCDRFLIAASRDYEVAYQQLDGKHGVLTGALLAGLNPHLVSEFEWLTNRTLRVSVEQKLQAYYETTKIPQSPLISNHGEAIKLIQGRAKPHSQNQSDAKNFQNLRLEPHTINELVKLLRPFLEDERNRRPFLVLALGNDEPVLQHISWGGAVASFIPDMVCKLTDYGEVAPGKQALWALLEYVRSQVGVDVQQRIDKLICQLNLPASTTSDVDGLVQKVRKGLYDKIQNLHGTIQLLDIAHPVEIDRLYVDVNILEEPCSYSRLEIDELLRGREQREDFNRFGLSKVRERVTGLQAVKKYAKLMILGKPGSGKTTFLQHVVIECNQGYLLADRIPILIRLRDFVRQAKRVSNFSFDSHISSYLREVASQQEVTALLSAGKFLLLLDGLDEVPEENSDAVVDEIEFFLDNYDQNNFIITCRVQAQKYRLNRFNYVEVADFNSEQIVKFAHKWFAANSRNGLQEAEKQSSQLIELFNLPENQKIKELAVTPILLSLTCRVFDDKGKFYSKQSELYEQGLEILLSKWDDSRRIKRYSVYQNLSIEQKRKLLTYLAVRKFEQEQYMLFEQDEIQSYIAEYLDISLEDSQTLLESIEAQHGLLLERAQRIYSFSHLTFQEYFTAKWFIDHADWQGLINHVTDKHWREVFLLVVGMIKNAEEVLLMMKQKIDYIASDEKLQQFLAWLHQKFISVKAVYKPASLRAFCLSLALSPPELNFVLATDRFDTFSLSWNIDKAINPLGFDAEPDYNFIEFSRIFNPEIEDLFQTLQNQGFRGQCSEVNKSQKYFEQWWRTNGHTWTKEYRDIILEHHNISHSWQFSVRQKKLLQQYYDANKLLLDCLNNNCVVSNAIRQEIENSLLLPIAEFENTRSSGFISEQ